ncbi:MAG: hypothetical protein J07HB67_00626 [halophilic archaeon J07HB67]|nr:MAG: hypothetical protein J07HB67_00626 [halophilic archaeon J07HB67]
MLLVLTAVESVGGVALGGFEATLLCYPTPLVLVPALLAIRGSVYGSLGSRLPTAVH